MLRVIALPFQTHGVIFKVFLKQRTDVPLIPTVMVTVLLRPQQVIIVPLIIIPKITVLLHS